MDTKIPGVVPLGILGEGSQNPDPTFGPKNVISHTPFQTWPLKSIPVFRPGGPSISNSNITLSFLFIWNRNDEHVDTQL